MHMMRLVVTERVGSYVIPLLAKLPSDIGRMQTYDPAQRLMHLTFVTEGSADRMRALVLAAMQLACPKAEVVIQACPMLDLGLLDIQPVYLTDRAWVWTGTPPHVSQTVEAEQVGAE